MTWPIYSQVKNNCRTNHFQEKISRVGWHDKLRKKTLDSLGRRGSERPSKASDIEGMQMQFVNDRKFVLANVSRELDWL